MSQLNDTGAPGGRRVPSVPDPAGAPSFGASPAAPRMNVPAIGGATSSAGVPASGGRRSLDNLPGIGASAPAPGAGRSLANLPGIGSSAPAADGSQPQRAADPFAYQPSSGAPASEAGAPAPADATRVAPTLRPGDTDPRQLPRTALGQARTLQPIDPSYDRRERKRKKGRRGEASTSPYAAGADANAPKKPRSRAANFFSIFLIVVGLALLGTAGFIFVRAQIGYKQAQETYAKLQEYAIKSDDGDQVPDVNFDELEKINPDVVGWIYVPGTVINYPVVQGEDNEKYLYKLFDLSGNGSGSIFMDVDGTSPGLVDQQTTLYGHHMNDKTMFYRIDQSMDQDSFDELGYVYYITRDNTYKLKPLFTMRVPDTYVEARTPNFKDEAAFTAYLEDCLDQAQAKASDAADRIKDTKQVITLVTCAGEIIPRTTRAGLVCSLEETTPRAQ